MLPAPIPVNETERLAALRALLILDTPPEERFGRIVAFAAAQFDVPIALMSLIDAHRQWSKSSIGVMTSEIPRATSFCSYAILGTEVLVVQDARADERFRDSPMVTEEPRIRFYAGAPLVLPSRHVLGTLCILDKRPRAMDGIGLTILSTLRDLILGELLDSRAGRKSSHA